MKELRAFYPLSDLCRALQLSRSAYYAWAKRQPSARQQLNQQLQLLLKSLFLQFKANYGSPRLTHALRARGHHCNHKRVERLMRQQGLAARRRRSYLDETEPSA